MENVRFALLLPTIHLLLAITLIYRDQHASWKYIAYAQAVRDQERTHPQISEGSLDGWDPCYEHHLSHGQRFLYTVEFPTGMLLGPDGTSDGCSPGVFTPMLRRLGDQMRIKTGWIFTDFLLAGGIWVQWYLIGVWLQFLEKRGRSPHKWKVSVAVITACGLLMTICHFVPYSELQDLIIALSSVAAFLCWIALLVIFSIKGITSIFDRLRGKQITQE